MNKPEPRWFETPDAASLPSPSLLIYPARVEENLERMLRLTGGPDRLRPHMKTHKMPDLIRLQVARGITKFKCATLAEAEMTAENGGRDVLVAYQMVGPNVARFLRLQEKFPEVHFSTLIDDAGVMRELSAAATCAGRSIEVLVDIDCGQHRCGVEAGAAARALYQALVATPGLVAGGLHVYDGHIHDSDPVERARQCDAAFAPAARLRQELLAAGCPVPRVVAGGTPTFPLHARRLDVQCSPGTCVFWDAGYATKLPDLDFLVAALLLTRVVSKPGGNRVCLDLGHKAVASENPHPRAHFPDVPDARAVGHSEEHLVIETARAAELRPGEALYAVPWHICPTVALHSTATIIRDGRAQGQWKVTARERVLTI